jgi:alpha-L-fucosidase 2
MRYIPILTTIFLLSEVPARADSPPATPPSILPSLSTTWDSPPPSFPGNQGGATGGVLLGNGGMAASLGGPPHELRFFITRNDFWRLSNNNHGKQKIAAILDVKIPALESGTFRMTQAIRNGSVHAEFDKDPLKVQLGCWLAATQDLMVIELQATGGETQVELALHAPNEPPSEVVSGGDGGTSWVGRKYAKDVDIPSEAATVMRVLGTDALKFTLKPGTPATVVIASSSAFKEPQSLDETKARIARATPAAIATLKQSHDRWWSDYWKKSWVELNDPVLMKGYYQGLYTLAAASRDPRFPPGIFGPWITTDNPPWSNDYHLNYNFFAPFYGLHAANRIEQADPHDAPLIEFMPRGRWYAENVTKTRGVLYPVGIGPMGMEFTRGETYGSELGSIEQGGLFHHQRSNAAYSLVNIAQRWRTTHDPAYARKVYPFVLAVCEFWEDYLKHIDGKYHIHGDAIHELTGPNKNPVLTLGLLRNAFDLAIDMSTALGQDAARRAKWSDILENLADFPVQQRNAKTVFRYTTEGPEWVDGNTLGIQHIYPGNAITLDSDPLLLEISRNTIAEMNRWHDGNGSNSFFPAAVRVGYDPETILREMRTYIAATWPNGFRAGNIHGIENCGTVHNTIQEMLCMSAGHVVRLFPVWPKTHDASFANLRTWGAFLVSAELKDGVIGNVRITSERGRECLMDNPWPDREVRLVRNGREAESLSGNRLTFKTTPGETIIPLPVHTR